MRYLLALLLTFTLALNAYASAAQVRLCCADEECSVAQCVEMGCLTAASPALAQQATPRGYWNMVRALPEERLTVLPSRYQRIWTPPD